MMNLYPARAVEALEFHKIVQLLELKCRTQAAKERVQQLKFQTKSEVIEKALLQTEEYLNILSSPDYFPNDFTRDIKKELQLIGIAGATLGGEQLLAIKNLALSIKDLINWFKRHPNLYLQLFSVCERVVYEKAIPEIIQEVIDDQGNVRDHASKELYSIRMDLAKSRHELRKLFETILRKLNKQGYLADISEGFLNGRRTVAILAEHKRIVKGILHGESDTQKTVFIEPEETIELNNEIFSLERAENREVHRILSQVTATLSGYQPQLLQYFSTVGIYDFIRAKALLAKDMEATRPIISQQTGIRLIKAFHPLLYLQHKQNNKPTIPLNITLDKQQRILIISGPNAGGKTVSMKTVGLLQLMVQSGLLIPASGQSEVGIFKQMMIHIGDTQSIEHELSTYSAHLRDMNYFMEYANGKTLFFIDELGSGSDPNLGGAFAEAIVEELTHKHSFGIITTHYLNLKVMAGKVAGIVNGAMSFDEEHLEPLYRLEIGKPGSSYTFAIAERTGLPKKIIDRARQITDRGHFKLDKMLSTTEQQAVRLGDKEKKADAVIKENERLKLKYEELTNKERLRQHFETLKLQNKIKKEELDYLRDMERKFKQIIHDWKKAADKQEVISAAEKLLFKRKQLQSNEAAAKKTDKNYEPMGKAPQIGDWVRSSVNHQVGKLISLKDKKGVVQIGNLPFTVQLEEWVAVRKKLQSNTKKSS